MSKPVVAIVTIVFTTLLSLIRRKVYGFSMKQLMFIIVYTLAAGLTGSEIFYLIENGEWGGIRFYGAVLLIPLFSLLLARITKLPVADMEDFAPVLGLSMFSVYKTNCYLTGCCTGCVIAHTAEGVPIYFPSQIAEVIVTLMIVATGMILERDRTNSGKIFPICMILYSSTRFILQFFRWDTTPFLFGIPAAYLWSIIGMIFGTTWFVLHNKKQKQQS